jgi:hypothetical protein
MTAAPVQRATVAPAPIAKVRRQHWLGLALARRGRKIADAPTKIGRDASTVGRWFNGTTVPCGAEVTRLAVALAIPEGLIENPPATDAECLARWHYGDEGGRLQEAM